MTMKKENRINELPSLTHLRLPRTDNEDEELKEKPLEKETPSVNWYKSVMVMSIHENKQKGNLDIMAQQFKFIGDCFKTIYFF